MQFRPDFHAKTQERNQRFLEQLGVLIANTKSSRDDVRYYNEQLMIRQKQLQILQDRVKSLESSRDELEAHLQKVDNSDHVRVEQFQEMQDKIVFLEQQAQEYENLFINMSAELDNRKQKVLALAEQNRRLIEENSVIKTQLSRSAPIPDVSNSKYVQTEFLLQNFNDIPPIAPAMPRHSTQVLPGLTAPSQTEKHEGLDSIFTQSTHLLQQLELGAQGAAKPPSFCDITTGINTSTETDDQNLVLDNKFTGQKAVISTGMDIFSKNTESAQPPVTRYSEAVKSQVTVEQSNGRFDEQQNMLINISTASYDHNKNVSSQVSAYKQISSSMTDLEPGQALEEPMLKVKESSNVGMTTDKLEISSESDINDAEVLEKLTRSPRPAKMDASKPQTPFVLQQNDAIRPPEDEENVTDSVQNSQKFVVLQSKNLENLEKIEKNEDPQKVENQDDQEEIRKTVENNPIPPQNAAQSSEYVQSDNDFADFQW